MIESPQRIFLGLLIGVMVYLFGAAWHHYRHKTFRLEIIAEYLLIAALALIIYNGLLG